MAEIASIRVLPSPNAEAIAFLKNKPAVFKRVFSRMLPELRARAFTVAGIEDVNLLQNLRDTIAELPAGGDWDKLKKSVAAQISPWLVDANADAEEQDKQVAAANSRAELLLRQNGFQAYAAAEYQVLDAQRQAFPYWRYQTMEDGAVRAEHAALNNIILPADSPFWQDHYPPWDWGCRCIVIPMTGRQVDEVREQEAGQPPEERSFLPPERQKALVRDGTLDRGPIKLIDPNDPDRARVTGILPGGRFDVSSPARKKLPGAFRWEPGSLVLSPADLEGRYDPPVWSAFVTWAKKQNLSDGKTVWDWMNSGAVPAEKTISHSRAQRTK